MTSNIFKVLDFVKKNINHYRCLNCSIHVFFKYCSVFVVIMFFSLAIWLSWIVNWLFFYLFTH